MEKTRIKHDCSEELREHELKATRTRLAVLKLLERANHPVDVATIIDYLDKSNIKADPVTAFRIVNQFTDKGLIKKIQLHEGKFRYEHSAKADHHHFVCERCGAIEDISDCNIDVLEHHVQQKKGLLIKRHSLEFFGICKQCQH